MVRTVLWPSDLLPSVEGIYYGWTSPLLVVAGVTPSSEGRRTPYNSASDCAESQEAIAAAVAHPQWRVVQDMFTQQPGAIGYCDGAVAGVEHPRFRLIDAGQDEDFQIVLYRRHRRQSMRFYTFDFNELDILPLQDSPQGKLPAATKNANASLSADFTRAGSPASRGSSTLNDEVLRQANFAQLFADIVDSQRRFAVAGARSTIMAAEDQRTDSQTSSKSEAQVANKDSPRFGILKGLHYLRDFSTTADQVDVRIEQGAYVAGEIPHVYQDKARTVVSISKYIKFHNCVWLILNDIIIGVAFGSFLCENQDVLAHMLDGFLQHYLVHRMELALLWLNNWPAGLKLNTELSQFYCYSLIGVVSAWGWLLTHIAPYFSPMIWVIGIHGCCGMTMIVSLLSDTLSVLTAHLYACYFISATVFRHQLSLAGSLWNLFRGKRYNVLRNRIDTWDYDLDQLLLGTILFTLLAFLYPTVLTYYALFATARLAVMMIHAVFDTLTALLNHFPLFALLLRAKDPLRLPGGVCIQRSHSGPLILTSQPAPLSSIFRHYAHLVGRLTTHYHPLRLLRQLASGRLITPIPRSAIRYNMIPVKGGTDGRSVPS